MPKSKFINHKGRNRRFTNPEELELERKKAEEQKRWKQQRGDESSSEEEDSESEGSSAAGDKLSPVNSEESSSEDENAKAKGVSNLIQVENPNRVQKKTKKLTSTTKTDDLAVKPELSRREREEIEKQRAQAHYQKLHAEGKTEQARADLARLAIIKQQRQEAQKRRELEKKEREDAVKQKTAQTNKALGKKK